MIDTSRAIILPRVLSPFPASGAAFHIPVYRLPTPPARLLVQERDHFNRIEYRKSEIYS